MAAILLSLRNFYFFVSLLLLTLISTAQAHRVDPGQAKIQLAILLDTSNSMDGLIDQTRAQLWNMVDELSKAKKYGKAATLEVAVLEYGNSNLSPSVGYIRTVTTLTSDLDLVSEALFALSTNGGDEYCGYVINTAVHSLPWSASPNDLKLIYVAGNEPFTQGPIHYESAIQLARTKGITVSTIFAGQHNEGVATGWQQGALLAGGNFMSVDHNQQLAHIVAPQDVRIADLNKRLNTTYVPYGPKGKEAKQRQEMQDQANEQMSLSMLAKRAKSKVSNVYEASSWDMVDALESEDFKVESVEEKNLPDALVGKSKEEKLHYLQSKKQEREQIKKEIKTLSEERETYVASERKKLAEKEGDTVSDVLITSIKTQAEKKDYEFSESESQSAN